MIMVLKFIGLFMFSIGGNRNWVIPRMSNPKISNAKMSNRVQTQLVQFLLTGIEEVSELDR